MKKLRQFLLLLILCLCLSFQVKAANRFWISILPSNWNNAANWSNVSGGVGGFSVPGSGDAVNFNALGLGNCTIDAPLNVLNFTVAVGYTGTISQGANTILINNNASFSGGSISGGSANISVLGNFTVAGTLFTATSAILEFDGNSTFTSGSFIHNNGTVRYNATGATSISGLSPIFSTLEFVGNGFNYNINSTGDITVLISLNLTGALPYNLNTGTMDVNGDINVSNTAAGCSGSALININGIGVQNFNGSNIAGAGSLPQVTINKISGSLKLANFPASSNNFTYTAGTLIPGTSTYCFIDGTAATYSISGSLGLNNIRFLAITNATFNLSASTILTASGDFTMSGTSRITINTGNIFVNGNLFLTNTATTGGGTAIVNIVGIGNQTLDGTAIAQSQNLLPYIIINKASGTLLLKGNISVSQDWTYTSGLVDATGFASTVVFGGNSLNVTSTGMSFYNLTVTANTITLINSATIKNNLSITGGHLAPGSNTINLFGSWSDYSSAGFTEATSTVNFNGSGLQIINTSGGENFNNLTINNSVAGIQLTNNTSVATVLTMTQGNIDLNGNTLTLGTSAAIANIGTLVYTSGTIINTGSFIRWFAKASIATGSSAGLFPVGSTTNYRPFYVSAPVAPTTGGTINLSYADISGNQLVSFLDGSFTVQVIKSLNWSMLTGNGLAGGNYSLDAQGTGLGTIGNVADLRVTLVNGVVGTAGTNAGTIADPQVNRTGLSVTDLSNSFFIGSVNFTTSPLPLTLMAFTANLIDQQAKLQWETATETNIDFFTVQRSVNTVSWKDVKDIPGNHSIDSISYYTAYDPTPQGGTTYYRIRQTTTDGIQTLSDVKSVEKFIQGTIIQLYPNPASDNVFIHSIATGSLKIMLFNSLGQRIIVPQSNNDNNLILSVNNLPAGIYFIRIDQSSLSTTMKITIRK
jgi:hypothetical protein